MPLIDKSGKTKGFALIVTPEKVHQELLKLNRVDFLGRKILTKEAISTRKTIPKQNRPPNYVMNNFPENQYPFEQPRIVPSNKLYVAAVSEREVKHAYEERIFEDNHKERKLL